MYWYPLRFFCECPVCVRPAPSPQPLAYNLAHLALPTLKILASKKSTMQFYHNNDTLGPWSTPIRSAISVMLIALAVIVLGANIALIGSCFLLSLWP